MSSADRTPDQIAADIAATRNRLADTVDHLVFRVQPKTIAKRQVSTVQASFSKPDGAPDPEKIGKAAAIAVGVLVVLVVIRKVVG